MITLLAVLLASVATGWAAPRLARRSERVRRALVEREEEALEVKLRGLGVDPDTLADPSFDPTWRPACHITEAERVRILSGGRPLHPDRMRERERSWQLARRNIPRDPPPRFLSPR